MLANKATLKHENQNQRSNLAYAVDALIAVAGSLQPSDLGRAKVLEAFALYDGLAVSTRYQRATGLRQILRYLQEECGTGNLAQYVPRCAHPLPRNITVTEAERDKILSAAPPALLCWLLLCSDLAIRSGTAARLCPQEYDAASRTLQFETKYQSKMTLPVTSALALLLSSVLPAKDATQPFVALLSKQGRMKGNRLRQMYQALLVDLKIERRIVPHDLRRTTATRVYTDTKDLRLVQALLGHRYLQSTLYYLDHHATPVPLSALELAKLNAVGGVQ